MTDALAIDKREVRRAFDNAAPGYDAKAVLQHEVCARMLERLDYIRQAPQRILDAGSGTGNAMQGLLERYSRAQIVSVDLAPAMLRRARGRLKWWQGLPGLRRPLDFVCADIERLPLGRDSIGFVWSNLALQWAGDLPAAFREFHRVLTPGGLLMFSTFGPDTLKELRSAYEGADGRTHVSRFTDMHDMGDMLVGAGYADPVMDMEQLTLTYDDVRALMRDLKAIGAHNATRGRPEGLSPKSALRHVERRYEAFRRDGKLPATFEIVYGHAWKPQPRVDGKGRPVIEIRTVTGDP